MLLPHTVMLGLAVARPPPPPPGFVNGGSPPGVPFATDCALRTLAWEYGQTIAPQNSKEAYGALFDAMQLARCNVTAPPQATSGSDTWHPPTFGPATETNPLFVDPTATGSDSGGDGTQARPFRTIARGLAAARAATAAGHRDGHTLLLRAGTFYLPGPVVMTEADAHTVIQNYRGEDVSVSGGVLLSPRWRPHPTKPFAIVATLDLDAVPGLRLDGGRAIRARYPNIDDPEQHSAIVPLDGWIRNKTQWVPPTAFRPAVEVNASATDFPGADWPMNESGGVSIHETGAGGQGFYTMGLGGPCDEMWPQYGYACGRGGGPRAAGQHMHPSGVHYDALLPNAPYTDAAGAVLHAWRPAHWFTVQFEVGEQSEHNRTFTFSGGGFQGSEGFSAGAEWFIENVVEELDAPLEFFYDKDTKELSFVPNGTLPVNPVFVATQHKVLFELTGAGPESLVNNVTIRGLRLRDTAQSYLDPHGLPSGGDWALPYSGGVKLNNTAGVIVDANLFTRMDGIGVTVLGRNENTVITGNEFEYLGGSAIVLWGRTSGALDAKGERQLPWSDHPNGPDSMGLDCPRDTVIANNLAHDLGLWQKQSSFVFQAVSARSVVKDNVVYNLPRAAINLNDGHCGGDVISGNLLANTCRESGDHGPINSWDRVPYLTPCLDGTSASIVPAMRHITKNLIVGTYSSQECIDNDDGSARYRAEENVLVFGQYGMKSDFGGWQNHHADNIYAYVCSCMGEGINDTYQNNTCIVRDGGGCYFWPQYASDCESRAGPVPLGFTVGGNGVYSSKGNVTVCEERGRPGGKYNLTTWVKMGHDAGSFEAPHPTDETMASWVKAKLGF